jgi:hypothetical protein
MSMLTSALAAICDMLGTQTAAEVFLGLPDNNAPGIYVWPWRLGQNVVSKNAPPVRTTPPDIRPPVASDVTIHFLVLVKPALTADGLSKLDAARQAILDHPILNVDGKDTELLITSLSHPDLAALFTAASLPLTICLSATLREKL